MKVATSFLWLCFALFFRSRAIRAVAEICPQGTQAAIGGRYRRNLNTLGERYIVAVWEGMALNGADQEKTRTNSKLQ